MIDTIRRFKTPSLKLYKNRYNAFNGQKQQNAARTFFFFNNQLYLFTRKHRYLNKKDRKIKEKRLYIIRWKKVFRKKKSTLLNVVFYKFQPLRKRY